MLIPDWLKQIWMWKWARRDLDARKYEVALEGFRKYISRYRDDPAGYIMAGYCSGQVGRSEEATEYLERALQINPISANAHAQLSTVQMKAERFREAAESLNRAFRINPKLHDDATSLVSMGYAQSKTGNWEAAAEWYSKAAKLQPNAENLRSLGSVYCHLQRYDEAIEAYKAAISANPKDSDAYNGLAWSYDRLGRDKEAASAYFQMAELTPQSGDAIAAKAWAYSRLNKYQEAAEAYEQAIAMGFLDGEIYHGLGWSYCALYRFSDAIPVLRRAVELKSTLAGAWLHLAGALASLSRFEEAGQELKKAIREIPDDADIQYLLGSILCEQGRYAEGRQCFEKSLRLRPDDFETQLSLSYLRARIGFSENEIADFLLATTSSPGDLDGLRNLAAYYLVRGDDREAIAAFERMLKAGVSHHHLFEALAWSHAQLGQHKDAICDLEKASEINPDRWDACYELSVGYLEAKDFEKARAYARESLQINPQWPLSYVVIAEAEEALGNVSKAIETLNAAITLDPLSPHPYAHLAELYLDVERSAEACDLARKSIELKPNFPDGHFVLGLVYEKLGVHEKAKDHVRIAEELDPVVFRKLKKAFERKSKRQALR